MHPLNRSSKRRRESVINPLKWRLKNTGSLVRENGMRVAIIVGHQSLPDGLNKRENHDRIEQEILGKISKSAAANDIPGLICFSGNREGKSDEEGRDNTIEGLLRVAKAAEDKGVNLCIELLNSKVNHPDYQCDRTPWGVEVCKGVNSPRVQLLYDIYHMQIMEGESRPDDSGEH